MGSFLWHVDPMGLERVCPLAYPGPLLHNLPVARLEWHNENSSLHFRVRQVPPVPPTKMLAKMVGVFLGEIIFSK